MAKRTYWFAYDLGIKDEPLAKSLIEYRQKENRYKVPDPNGRVYQGEPNKLRAAGLLPNLISSITEGGTKQMPIIDLDFPHHIEQSSTDGHHHLYIDIPMSKWKWFWLMWGLYQAGVVEMGYFVWSLRRGGNFVRLPGWKKTEAEEPKATYGWFRKLK